MKGDRIFITPVCCNPCFLCLQSRLKEAVQLLEDYKHGTLPPGVTNKEVGGKSLSYVSTASCSLKTGE